MFALPTWLKNNDRYVAKKRELLRKRQLAEQREKILQEQAEYREHVGRFLGLSLKDNEIEVKPIPTVEDFMIEGDELGHCVYANEYYKKADSLILSARIQNQRIETIEVSLAQMSIKQARGKGNQATEYHDRIVNLVQSNMPKIAALV